MFGHDIALGPGKVALLEHIGRTGSLRKAAEAMEMSYMRAWTLVQTMNHCFKKPLVITRHGGTMGGGALVTVEGKAIAALYRRMEAQSLRSTKSIQAKMTKYLR